MILGIQLIGLIFGVFMLYLTYLHFRRKEYTTKEFTFWILIWVTVIYVSMLPNTLDFIVAQLSIGRTMDFFIIMGFMLLFALFFYMYLITRSNQKKLEELVRKMALNMVDDRTKGKK